MTPCSGRQADFELIAIAATQSHIALQFVPESIRSKIGESVDESVVLQPNR